ncbi:MAG: serine hydrolase [Acidimicrobiia bacterium]
MSPTRHARLYRLILVPMLLALAVLAAPAAPAAAVGGVPASQPPASYILVDADRGTVLLAKNEHQSLYTASTIKVLTALTALERLPLDAPLHVSALAASQPASKIDMKEGSTWPLDQALHSLMIISANDAAYALAENAGGSLAGFAKLATKTGQRLGLQDTSFHDPAGLDGAAGFEGGTTSSAYDLSIVARNALSVPAIAGPASLVTYEFTDPTGTGRRLVNHNRGFLSTYPGAIGLKTGFTDKASRTLITAARRDGRTLIAVVMGTWDDTGWAGYLLDQGFAGADGGTQPVHIPPVRIAPIDGRAGSFANLPHPLGTGTIATKAPTTPATAAATATTVPASTKQPASGALAAAVPSAASGSPRPATVSDSGSSWSSVLEIGGIVVLALLGVLVVLRRRAVRRHRARRIERLRAHREARRRGMIDVIEVDDAEADVRVMPIRTSHHVAASAKRHPADRRVLRPARPRDHRGIRRD